MIAFEKTLNFHTRHLDTQMYNHSHQKSFLNWSAPLNPLRHRARVGLDRLVAHLVELVPHLGGAAPDLARGDQGRAHGGLGYSVQRSELFLG